MRLDHLLSREYAKGETWKHILRSIGHSNVFVRDSASMKVMQVKHLRGWVDKETHSVTEAVYPKR